MGRRQAAIAGAAALALMATGAAMVSRIPELRLGIYDDNVLDQEHKEGGANVQLEAVFDAPSFLRLIGAPRPYLMASVNTGRYTDWAGGGLYWRWAFADHWALEPGAGIVVHDGKLNEPDGSDRISFGSRTLFRLTLALEREIDAQHAVQLVYEHLSNGQILGHGRNQGVDNIGLRLVMRLGES